jgi:hypothetical protein
MNYLSQRLSSLSSLVILLVLSIGTAFLFSFATRTIAVAENLFDESVITAEETPPVQSVQHGHTRDIPRPWKCRGEKEGPCLGQGSR